MGETRGLGEMGETRGDGGGGIKIKMAPGRTCGDETERTTERKGEGEKVERDKQGKSERKGN